MKIIKFLLFFGGISLCSHLLLAGDFEEQGFQLGVLENNKLEITLSETQIKQAIIYFSTCLLSEDECLQNLHQATCSDTGSDLELSSHFGCNLIDASQPVVPILFSALAGYLLGGLNEHTLPAQLGVRIGCACVMLFVVAIFCTGNYFHGQKKLHALAKDAQIRLDALAPKTFEVTRFIRNANTIRVNGKNILQIETLANYKYKLTIYSQDLLTALQSLDPNLSFSAATFQKSLKKPI